MNTLKPESVRARLADPTLRQAALVDLAEWVKDTCLIVGTSTDTAYTVAGIFVKGVDQTWEQTVPLT